MFRKDLVVETKAVDVKRRIVPVVASTASIDSYDEIVEQVWDFGRFDKNPVVLWNHNRIFQQDTRPIGRAENYRVENEGTDDAALKADLHMASKEANEHAHSVLLLFAEGIQKAVSVGFNPRDIRREMRDNRDIIVLSDNELLEISATPIGANEDALAEQRAAELAYIKAHLSGTRIAVPRTYSTSHKHGDDNQGANMNLEEVQAALKAAEAELAKVKAENAAYKAQNESLAKERDGAIERAEKAEKAISDAEDAKKKAEREAKVDKLVGTKIAPADREHYLELLTSNPELYDKMVKQLRLMTHLERSVGADQDPDAGNSHKHIDDDGASASDALTSEAYG